MNVCKSVDFKSENSLQDDDIFYPQQPETSLRDLLFQFLSSY